jgi:predicted nucleic acid-binding Zn ribbon protein
MPKQAAKHHKKAARHEHVARHARHVRAGKPTRTKKVVTRDEQVLARAYAEPAPDTVEVTEIEIVSVSEDSLEVDEAELSVPREGFFEEEE